jgi:glucose-1-phosphate adenylyltransferase
MFKDKVLALILAGGTGGRLETLTENRAKPVMPFGGFYRLIDFALSNCAHSKISDVWVIEQYELHSLNEHLSNGRPWDLDRTYGGLLVLPPFENKNKSNDKDGGFARGNADAIYRHREFIKTFNPDILIVLSADHIYKLDFREVIREHLKNKADLTMVTTKVPPDESASRFGVVKTDKNGRVTEFNYKPENPESDLITTEVFVYNATVLLETLQKLADESGEKNLQDFGHKLIPNFVENGRAFEFRYENYWRDVGTVSSYWRANMDLLDGKNELDLDDKNWAILTLAAQRVPAFISAEAKVNNSLIAHGCKIEGQVNHSILAAGVKVEKGAQISDSIILQDAVIKSGARVRAAIIDAEAVVSENAVIGLPDSTKISAETNLKNEEITIIGQNAEVAPKQIVEAGARISNNKVKRII